MISLLIDLLLSPPQRLGMWMDERSWGWRQWLLQLVIVGLAAGLLVPVILSLGAS